MFDILTICPRLEELYYTVNSDIYNSFIIQLAKLCPNLKKIQILCNDDCSSELQVTDEGLYEFLKLLPQLEYVSFHPCSNIRGEIFKKIGEFSQLKYFNITRGSYDQPVPLEKDIHFGGGTLSKLECIDFGSKEYSFNTSEEFDKFVTTLRSVAPHLKYLGDLLDIDVSMDDKKKVVQLFSDTLTDLDVGYTVNHLAPILPKNLTSLRMKINDEFVSQNVLNQLQPNHSLKKLSITVGRQISPEIIVAIIEKLAVDIYPCVTHLEFYSTTKQKKVSTNPHGEIMDTVLSNIKIWPNLLFLDGEVLSMNRILAVRPRLRFYSMWDNDLNFDDNVSLFYYQWLVLDQPFEEW
ncbi:hypothetical protein C9374_013096 [Naegleria lovaniensis]|uniref:F-box domain-containing protein n=1 Tax=Naegleria lovaniensis TaxID=51637 RepID=A0AA88KDF4_NAELO|nr:uncharacterized protein C9374_013096 [Naegleria lovaniensis]KAG2372889.1 hypothetical protein C9374_013096 [Naegleria lovaniensis]